MIYSIKLYEINSGMDPASRLALRCIDYGGMRDRLRDLNEP